MASADDFSLGRCAVALLSGSMVKLVRKFIGRYDLPLVIASLLWLSWQFLSKANAQTFMLAQFIRKLFNSPPVSAAV